MDARANSAPMLVTVQPSRVAPRLPPPMPIGATSWAPVFVIVAGQFESVLTRFVSGFSFAGATQMFAMMWALRFASMSLARTAAGITGYGVNGVIVNPRLTLAERRGASRATGSASC